MKISLKLIVLGIMGNGNDPPSRTINSEFSDEKHAITK